MKKPVRILIVEDIPEDADLAKHEISKILSDCEFQVVETYEGFLRAIEIFQPDVILSDYTLPRFDGLKALELTRKHAPLIPFIIWAGSISENLAVECMRAGANNYILKDNLRRLGPAIVHALEERNLLVDRKQAEEALQNNEKRFRALIENGLDDISLLAVDGSLLWESPSTVRNLGYQPNEFVGRNIFELMHPDDLEWTRKIYATLLQRPGDRQRGTFRLRRSDGTWRWVEAIVTNMLDDATVNAIVVNYRDITEQKQAEIELQQRNDDLALINTLNEFINRGENLDTVVNRLRNEFKRIFSNEYTAIYLLNQDGQSIKLYRYSIPPEVTRRIEKVIGRSIPTIEIPVGKDGLFQSVLRSGYGMVISDPKVLQKWIGEFGETTSLPPIAKAAIRKLLPQIYKILNIKSTILVPLISDGKALGVLNVSSSNIFSEQDLKRIENIGGQLTTALRRRQVEEALNEERNLLRTLIDNLPDRVYAMDMQGRKTLSNIADWKASGGKTMEDVIGKTDFDTYPPELAEEFWKLDRAVLDSGQPVVNYEEPGLDADGNRVSVLTTKIPLRDETGNVIGLVGIGRDITERKRAEKALYDSEQRYRALFEDMPIAIWEEDLSQVKSYLDALKQQGVTDFRTYFMTRPDALLECAGLIKVLDVNNAAVRMFEADSKEQLIESTDNEVSQGEREHLHEFFADIAERQTSNSWEGADKTLTGRPVEINLSWSVAPGKQEDDLRVIVTTRDITERRQAEETLRESQNRYRTLIETQTEFIVRWKPDGTRTFANEAYCRYFRLNPEQAFSSSFMPLIHEEDRQSVEEKIHRLVSGASLVETEAHRVIKPDGTIGWQEWTDQTIRDENGNLIELQSVGRDITERKKTEIERQALLEIMQGLANTKDLPEFLKLVHQSVAKVIYAENFFVVIYHQDTGLFEEIYSVDQYDAPEPPSRLENSITSYVFGSGRPLLLTQASFDELVAQGEMKLIGTDSASWLGVPLKTSGRTIGVMAVQDYENVNRYSEPEKDFLVSIAAQVALAIERKQAEEALHQSDALYRQAIEVAGAVPYYESYHDEGRLIKYEFIGEGIRQITGYGPEEFSATLWDSLVEEVNLVEELAGYSLEEGIQRVRSGKNSIWKCEHRLRDRDGKIHWVFEAAVELRDENGVSHGSIGTYQDVTMRKQAEEAEREQRILAEALRDTAETLSSTLDYGEVLDHILTAVGRVAPHDAATIMLIEGESARVVRSQGYEAQDFNSGIMGIRLPLAETPNLKQIVETRQPVVIYDTHTYPGWKRRPVTDWLRSSVGAPISIYGEVIGFICLDGRAPEFFTPVHAERLQAFANQAALAIHNARLLQQAQEEIAERKRSEDLLRESNTRFRILFEASPDAIVLIDPNENWSIIDCNTAACQMNGYAREELLGHCIDILNAAPGNPGERTDYLERVQRHGVLRYETSHRRKDGTVFAVDVSTSLIKFDTRDLILGIDRDATERKRAEEEIRRSAEETSALLKTSLALTNLDLEATLQTIGHSANTLFLADGCRIFLMEADGRTLRCVLALGENTDAFSDLRIRIGQGVTGAVAANGMAEIVNEMQNDPRAVQVPGTDEEQEAVMFAPLKERDRTIGILSVRRVGEERRFEPADLGLLEAFASMAASAVSNARLFEETQHRLADLHASEERFRQLADNIQEAFWMTDAENGREIYMSPAIESIWGRSIQSMMDEPNAWINSVFSEDRQVLLDAIEKEKGGEKLQLEYRIVRPDGSLRWIWDRAFPVFDASGKVRRIAGISADITERKDAAEKLRESEDRYHSLFQNQLHGSALHEIITNDQGQPVDYIFLKVNPAFEKMTGLNTRDLVGRRVTEVLPGIETERLIQIYGQVALTGEPAHLNEYFAPLGRYYEINAYATGPRQFAVSFMDVTERRQAEQELRKLSRAVEQSSSTIVITDISGNIEYVNPKFTQITGYSFEEVIGRNPRMLKSDFTAEEEYTRLWQTISNGGEWHGELLNKKKDGTLYWESVTISPIMNDRREITHFIGVKEDITERKQNEIETRRHIAELEAVYENGLSVGRLLEPAEIGDRVIETFARYLPWHHVTIRLRKEASDELELVAFSLPNLKREERKDAEQHFVAHVNRVGQGLSGWVIQTGSPLRTGNVHAHPQYIDTHGGIQSGLYMPLKVGERVIGVISVESEARNAFTEKDERLLATLANQTAIAFENARLYKAMQKELSERQRVEDALRVSETHYRALADSITDILFELDQELHYTHWNKASEAFTGIPAQDAIGKSMEEILGATEEQARIRTIYEDVLQSHQPRLFETALALGGEKRSFEVTAYPSMRGVSVVAKDVTDRKRAETIMQKRFELMEYSARHSLKDLMQKAVDEVSELTGSTIGFFHFMEEDQIHLGTQTWSTNALQLFHVSPEDGAHLPLDRAGAWAEAVRQRRPLIQNDYESLTRKKGVPQGHVPILREMVIPIIRNECMMAVMGVGNKLQDYTPDDLEIAARLADYAWDITERKQMELALEIERNQLVERVEERTADLSRANSNLARALRVKDEFLANMSHELRTPLNAILGLSESLGEQIAGPLNEKQQKYISTISESGHHLLSLINDILDLAKIDAGHITLDINKVDIRSVCHASLRMVKQLAQKKNQEISLKIDDGLGLMWADERRLKQMIVNLLGNAVKFTAENGKLGLEVNGDEESNQIALTVWDNGIGIKEEDLARLFQPFVQLDSGLAREATGTGLGLALVAQMARLHGGGVTAVSEAGKGSRFTIVLPWEPALAIDTASRMRVTGKFRAIQMDDTNKPTLLLVEDTQEVVMMLKDYLELAGYKVFTAQDGIDGIVQARHVKPDLILMDIQMPRMDGFETTRKLRSDPNFRYTPIIALTALAMPHDRERCLEAGMDEYISKPVNLNALVKIIQSCLFEQGSRTR